MGATRPAIFVSIASYCDPMLPWTLDDCLAKACHPEDLRFGICWQYDPAQAIDIARFRADKRFRVSTHHFSESQGGSWARAIAQEFWDGETYALQVDSHTAFAQGWDSTLIQMMRALPADRPLISANLPLFEIDEEGRARKDVASGIRTTRVTQWNADLGWAPWFDWGSRSERAFARNRFLSGNFVFTDGAWTDAVRQDPEHYYWGEEFALTLRSFTHGYDLFLPDEIVAWHMNIPQQPRRHWEHGKDVVRQKNKVAFERLRQLAYNAGRAQERLGRYGLGSRRSLAEYERFAGFDLASKRAHPDVFTGRSPDPVTIRDDADWTACMTFEEYSASLV
jgi:hypothetical protein